MRVLEGPIRLGFFEAGRPPADTAPGGLARAFVLDEKQRAAPPFRRHAIVIATVPPDLAPRPLSGATETIGPFIPRREWAGEPDEDRCTHLLLALTNARDGREDEFDDWYWRQHFPDGLALPGCFAGRRYLLADDGAGPYRHLAIYQYDIADIGETIAALAERSGTPRMPITDAISPVFEAWFVRPSSPWR